MTTYSPGSLINHVIFVDLLLVWQKVNNDVKLQKESKRKVPNDTQYPICKLFIYSNQYSSRIKFTRGCWCLLIAVVLIKFPPVIKVKTPWRGLKPRNRLLDLTITIGLVALLLTCPECYSFLVCIVQSCFVEPCRRGKVVL